MNIIKKLIINCIIKIQDNKRLLSFILIVLLIPIIVIFLFSIQAPFSFLIAIWTPGEQLLYFGGVITFLSIFITINVTNKNLEIEHREKVLPYMILNTIDSDSSEYLPGIEVNKSNNIIIEIKSNRIEYSKIMNSKISDFVSNKGMRTFKKDGVEHLTLIPFIYIPFKIINYGVGNAIDLRIGLNSEETIFSERRFLPTFSYKINKDMNIYIFTDQVDEKNTCNYILDIIYGDIYQNEYIQSFKFEFIKEEDGFKAYLDPKSKQKITKENLKFKINQTIKYEDQNHNFEIKQ